MAQANQTASYVESKNEMLQKETAEIFSSYNRFKRNLDKSSENTTQPPRSAQKVKLPTSLFAEEEEEEPKE